MRSDTSPGSDSWPRDSIGTSPDRVAEETRAAALAYLIWPLALVDRITPRPQASNWYRYHLRQARRFGALVAVAGFAALLWPLVLSVLVANAIATLWIYSIAILADLTLFVLWLILAVRYSQRAGNGELFELPRLARKTGRKAPK